MNMGEEDSYRNCDLFDEIITWRALLRSFGSLDSHNAVGFVHNLYGETYPALEFITETNEDVFLGLNYISSIT